MPVILGVRYRCDRQTIDRAEPGGGGAGRRRARRGVVTLFHPALATAPESRGDVNYRPCADLTLAKELCLITKTNGEGPGLWQPAQLRAMWSQSAT